MTVYESIETRKSIRDFEKRPVEPEKLQRILEAGRLAPTARCSNATRFIVVDDPDLMKKVQEACMGQALMGKAPMAVIVCSDSTITVHVNGQLQNRLTGLSNRQGFIGLQSEGGPVQFRNIILTPLD